MSVQTRIDPITLEVIKNRLDNIADEAQLALMRSAYSTSVKEASDASCAVFDSQGETLAQAHLAGGAVHLGALAVIVRRLLEIFPPETLKEGDILCTNDPYSGAHHLPDLIVVAPVMVNGKMVALTATMCHHQDVGGKVPGSTPTDSTDIFQEGLRIPPAKLYEAGSPNELLFSLIRANVRTPDVVIGDIRAQLAACLTAKRRLVDMFDEFGVETTQAYTQELLDRAETATRAKIAEIPDGSYSFEDYLDNDGIDLDRRVKVRVTVTVAGSELLVDFAGTDDQVRGPINSVPSVAAGGYLLRGEGNHGPEHPQQWRVLPCRHGKAAREQPGEPPVSRAGGFPSHHAASHSGYPHRGHGPGDSPQGPCRIQRTPSTHDVGRH